MGGGGILYFTLQYYETWMQLAMLHMQQAMLQVKQAMLHELNNKANLSPVELELGLSLAKTPPK